MGGLQHLTKALLKIPFYKKCKFIFKYLWMNFNSLVWSLDNIVNSIQSKIKIHIPICIGGFLHLRVDTVAK